MNFKYQTNLPIFQMRDEIVDAIINNQVVIIAGETGSGKTTQIPLVCFDAGRGQAGKIVCTQPRRIAAISLANYTASQCDSAPGETIAFKVRFKTNVTESSKIIFVTDGILLSEIMDDPYLSKYDTVIIDEAHERSINIDFLIGHLRAILPYRKDLKLIISSATIDTRLFSRAFNNAPVITVSGRLFPVDILYRPVIELWKGESMDSYVEGALVVIREILEKNEPGDILIFLPTIQDINELKNRIEPLTADNALLIPLHSRLSTLQQQLIFKKMTKRKIVIATNIAETSITVPGIRFVIDSGLVRMSRYEPLARLTLMPVEKISRASADQRAGRCGRVQNGVCFRLYSEADYVSRKLFTTPEIQRSNLAGVILRMCYNGLGDPARFLFLQRPSEQALRSAFKQLQELGAINRKGEITISGKEMAKIPVDPPVARMLIYARDADASREVMVIAAGVSIEDPFSESGTLDNNKKFRHSTFESDYMRLLQVWKSCRGALRKKQYSSKALFEYCKAKGLSPVRMSEWFDTWQQIRRICRTIKGFNRSRSAPASYEAIHKSLLSGFFQGIACLSGNNVYSGIHVDNIRVFPSSVLFGKSPKWILFHEIVETSRIYGRTAAVIRPEWVEQLFCQRCNYTIEETWYDQERGIVRAREEVSFKGLQLLTNRHVDLERKDEELAHDVFLKEALVKEQIGDRYRFIQYNRNVKAHISLLQRKFRKNLYLGDWALESFYRDRLSGVKNRQELNAIIKRKGNDSFLFIKEEELLAAENIPDENLFPDTIQIGKESCPVNYQYAPDTDFDGVTITVSEELFDSVPFYYWEWLLPVLWKPRMEIIVNEYRSQLVHMALKPDDVVNKFCFPHPIVSDSFLSSVFHYLFTEYTILIYPSSFNASVIPVHLWPVVKVVDKNGACCKLYRAVPGRSRNKMYESGLRSEMWIDECSAYEQNEFVNWNPLFLKGVPVRSSGQFLAFAAYPALCLVGEKTSVRVFYSFAEASVAHAKALGSMLESKLEEVLCWELESIVIPSTLILKCKDIRPELNCIDIVKSIILDQVLEMPETLPVDEQAFCELMKLRKEKLVHVKENALKIVENVINAIISCKALLRKKRLKYEKTYLAELYSELNERFESYCNEFFTDTVPVNYRIFVPHILAEFAQRIECAYNDPNLYKARIKMYRFYLNCIEQLTEESCFCSHCDTIRLCNFRITIEQFLICQFNPGLSRNRPAITQQVLQEALDDLQHNHYLQ